MNLSTLVTALLQDPSGKAHRLLTVGFPGRIWSTYLLIIRAILPADSEEMFPFTSGWSPAASNGSGRKVKQGEHPTIPRSD